MRTIYNRQLGWSLPCLSSLPLSPTFPNISFSCSYSYRIACQVRPPFHWFNCSKPCLSHSSSPSAPLLSFRLIWALSFVAPLVTFCSWRLSPPLTGHISNWVLVSALSTVLDYHLFMVLIFLRDMLFLWIFIILLSFHFFLAIFIFPRFYFCSLSFSQVLFFLQYFFFHTFYFFPITVWLSYTPKSKQMMLVIISSLHWHQDTYCSCSHLHCGDSVSQTQRATSCPLCLHCVHGCHLWVGVGSDGNQNLSCF